MKFKGPRQRDPRKATMYVAKVEQYIVDSLYLDFKERGKELKFGEIVKLFMKLGMYTYVKALREGRREEILELIDQIREAERRWAPKLLNYTPNKKTKGNSQ